MNYNIHFYVGDSVHFNVKEINNRVWGNQKAVCSGHYNRAIDIAIQNDAVYEKAGVAVDNHFISVGNSAVVRSR